MIGRPPVRRDAVLQMRLRPITADSVATYLHVRTSAAYQLLSRLARAGFVRRVGIGQYERVS